MRYLNNSLLHILAQKSYREQSSVIKIVESPSPEFHLWKLQIIRNLENRQSRFISRQLAEKKKTLNFNSIALIVRQVSAAIRVHKFWPAGDK